MKKLLPILILLTIFLALPKQLLSFTGLGSGTASDPYQIRTLSQLQEMNDDLDAHYILMNNIDASATSSWNGGKGFLPIGGESTYFTGALDGNNYNISYLYINDTVSVGLFAYISNAEIMNLGLEHVDISGGGYQKYCGALASLAYDSKITNCYSTGNIRDIGTETTFTGGLVAWVSSSGDENLRSLISNCYSSCSVEGPNGINNTNGGGLVGQVDNSKIITSNSSGTISGFNTSGGFVGRAMWNSIIEKCYSTSNVNTSSDNNSYPSMTGGFAGIISDTTIINKCFSSGTVFDTNNYCGGFAGRIWRRSEVSNSYSTSQVTGGTAGGFASYFSNCVITNCYANGFVQGRINEVGGFGGFGNTVIPPTFEDCFWDTETSGTNISIPNYTFTGITGESTTNMMTQSTFTNWDFNTTWFICSAEYPKLMGIGGLYEVWVSSSFCSTCTNDDHEWNCDAFDNLDNAQIRINTGGTIHTVGSYTYSGDLNAGDTTKNITIDIGDNEFVVDGDLVVNGNITFVGTGTITVNDDLNLEYGKIDIGPIDLYVEGYINGWGEDKYIIATDSGRVYVTTHSVAVAPVGTEDKLLTVMIDEEEGFTFGVRTDKQPALPGTGGLGVSWDIKLITNGTPNSDISFIYPIKAVEPDYNTDDVVVYHFNSESGEWEPYENSTTDVWSDNSDYYITTVYGVTDFSPFAVRTITPCSMSVSVNPSILWPPNNQMSTIQASVILHNNCEGATYQLTSITSNENISGDVDNADFNTADTLFDLRAKRLGRGTGRVYTITYTLTDMFDNTSTAEATVTVPHSQPRISMGEDNIDNKIYYLNIYPNPVDDKLYLDAFFPEQVELKLKILNILSQEIMSYKTAYSTKINETIDLINIPTGIYFLEININGEKQMRLFYKE